METDPIQDKIIEEFEPHAVNANRFRYFRQLIKIGSQSSSIQPVEMQEEHVLPSTKRKIWLKAWLENDKVLFLANSPSQISKAMTGLLLKIFSGLSPKEIINCNLYFLHEISLYDHLNEAWLEDFLAILQRIKSMAARLQLSATV